MRSRTLTASATTRTRMVEEFDGVESVQMMEVKQISQCTRGRVGRSGCYRRQRPQGRQFHRLRFRRMGRQCPQRRRFIRSSDHLEFDLCSSQSRLPEHNESYMS